MLAIITILILGGVGILFVNKRIHQKPGENRPHAMDAKPALAGTGSLEPGNSIELPTFHQNKIRTSSGNTELPNPAHPSQCPNSGISAFSQPVPPPEIRDWYNWTQEQRLDLVTEFEHNPELNPELVIFFKQAVKDRSLGLVTRNNICNALINQEKHDPDLASLFRDMTLDLSEDVQWRDYAMQHMASSSHFAREPRIVIEALWAIAQTGEGTMPGTALLHLNHIEDRGVTSLPNEYASMLGKIAENPRADLPTRLTCLGLIGRRKLTQFTTLVHSLAENKENPSIQRCALAALGSMGNPAEIKYLQKFTTHPDRAIATAAKGAIEHIANPSPSPAYNIQGRNVAHDPMRKT